MHRRFEELVLEKKKEKRQNEATSISDICWWVEDSSRTECSTLKNRAQPVTDTLKHFDVCRYEDLLFFTPNVTSFLDDPFSKSGFTVCLWCKL